MNKKGYTIVELLAVIVVLAILSGIGVITVNNFINASKEKSLNLQYESIEKAAKSFCSKHLLNEITPSESCMQSGKNCCTKVPGLKEDGQSETCYITLNDLIEDNLIDNVKDPKNGGYIKVDTLIEITYENNQFITKAIR